MVDRKQMKLTLEGVTLHHLQLLVKFNTSAISKPPVKADYLGMVEHLINSAYQQVRETPEYKDWVRGHIQDIKVDILKQ